MGWLDNFLNGTENTYLDTRESLRDLAHEIGTDATSRGDSSTVMDSASLDKSLSNDRWGE